MGGVLVPGGSRGIAFRPEEVSASRNSYREVVAAHDAESVNFHKTRKKLEKQVSRVRCDRYVASRDGLSIHAHPPEEVGLFREIETPECAMTRQRSQSGPGAAAWSRSRPVDA